MSTGREMELAQRGNLMIEQNRKKVRIIYRLMMIGAVMALLVSLVTVVSGVIRQDAVAIIVGVWACVWLTLAIFMLWPMVRPRGNHR